MKISNVRIKDVTIGLDELGKISAMVVFENQRCRFQLDFTLCDSKDAMRFESIMKFAGERTTNAMKGKIIRMVEVDNRIKGFGDSIMDRFIPIFDDYDNEVKENEFMEMLKSK